MKLKHVCNIALCHRPWHFWQTNLSYTSTTDPLSCVNAYGDLGKKSLWQLQNNAHNVLKLSFVSIKSTLCFTFSTEIKVQGRNLKNVLRIKFDNFVDHIRSGILWNNRYKVNFHSMRVNWRFVPKQRPPQTFNNVVLLRTTTIVLLIYTKIRANTSSQRISLLNYPVKCQRNTVHSSFIIDSYVHRASHSGVQKRIDTSVTHTIRATEVKYKLLNPTSTFNMSSFLTIWLQKL